MSFFLVVCVGVCVWVGSTCPSVPYCTVPVALKIKNGIEIPSNRNSKDVREQGNMISHCARNMPELPRSNEVSLAEAVIGSEAC